MQPTATPSSAPMQAIVSAIEQRLDTHGATPEGLWWPNGPDLAVRYGVFHAAIARAPASPRTSLLDFGDFGLEPPAPPSEADSSADGPLARKLELAEEFRQIGDLEGARDLLEEVVSKADGALKTKAQGMLEKLG